MDDLETQLQDSIVHNYWIDRDHHYRGDYVSDTSHLDGEDLPLGFTVTYGGDSLIEFADVPLAEWHRDHAIDLLEDGYEELLEFATEYGSRTDHRATPVPDGSGRTSDHQTVYAVFENGADQPLMHDWGSGQLDFLWKTEDDARRFLEAHMKEYGIVDPGRYQVVEMQVTDQINGEEALGIDQESWEEYLERQFGEDSDQSDPGEQSGVNEF